jgi:hypothetical protein
MFPEAYILTQCSYARVCVRKRLNICCCYVNVHMIDLDSLDGKLHEQCLMNSASVTIVVVLRAL